MTPADIFEKLGFSPIAQAIAGLAWFGVVLYTMLLAERNKKLINAVAGTSGSQPAPPSLVPIPDHLAKIADLSIRANELEHQAVEKLREVLKVLNDIAGRVNVIAGVREGQIDELIAAIKDNRVSAENHHDKMIQAIKEARLSPSLPNRSWW